LERSGGGGTAALGSQGKGLTYEKYMGKAEKRKEEAEEAKKKRKKKMTIGAMLGG